MTFQAPHDKSSLLRWIHARRRLAPLLARVSERGDDGDSAHDLSHLLRVALSTLSLLTPATEAEAEQAAAAALLHDFVNVPKDHPERARASSLSAEAAAPLLSHVGFTPDETKTITTAVLEHSYSHGAVPSTPLGAALQDADRLEALGAIGLLRCVSTGARMGARYFSTDDPWAKERALDDKSYSIDHFFTKLLRLPDTMRTAAGREEAAARARVLENFLDNLARELGEARP